MIAQWIAGAVGKMHIHRIENRELASKMGFTPQYVSMVLNGKKTPKNAESRFCQAIDELISERKQEDAT